MATTRRGACTRRSTSRSSRARSSCRSKGFPYIARARRNGAARGRVVGSVYTALLGAFAALVGVVGTVPYARDTLRQVTRPHPGTWLVWSLLAVVAFLAQRADGAS